MLDRFRKTPARSRLTRLHIAVAAIAVAGTALAASLVSASPDRTLHKVIAAETPPAKRALGDQLVVHEWGTFTSLQGSTGVELDGMHHEGEVLPGFVYSFAKAVPSPFQALGNRSGNVPVRRVRSKMETPVIYFHSNRARDVKVMVGFRRGLMSHYYPAPTRMAPEPKPGHAPHDTIDLSRLGYSFLEWDARIIPRKSSHGIPEVAPDNHYGFARDVDAARVRVTSEQHGEEHERFLFYRGLGHVNPRVRVVTPRARPATVHNDTREALSIAFAVEMTGERGRFIKLRSIAGQSSANFDLQELPFDRKDRVVAALSAQMQAALVAEGLYQDEARAMVRTWATQWFGEPGTRVLYIVPQSYVKRTLPLHITPEPDHLLRVFVGRIEYMTPAVEARIEDHLRDSGALDEARRTRAIARLARLGRFMEPKIRRVQAITRDPAVRDRAAAFLAIIAGNRASPDSL